MKYKLSDIDKKQSFKVPDGYFDDLSARIQKRVDEENDSKKIIPMSTPILRLAVAASIITLLTFVFLFNNTSPSAEQLLANIPEEELVAYLNQADIDEYDLISAFPEETNSLEFEDLNMLDGLEFGDESLDEFLQEYNLEEESLEI